MSKAKENLLRTASRIETYQYGGLEWKIRYGEHSAKIGRIGVIRLETEEGKWKVTAFGLTLKLRQDSVASARDAAILFAKNELMRTLTAMDQ